MADSKSGSKGNGASTRMSNPSHKALRAKSWKNAQVKKTLRVLQNEELRKEKKANGGLGRRELRRIEAGLRTRQGGIPSKAKELIEV